MAVQQEVIFNIMFPLCLLKAVQQLVRERAEVNARSNDGMTPLAIAAFWGYADIVKVLLENGSVAADFGGLFAKQIQLLLCFDGSYSQLHFEFVDGVLAHYIVPAEYKLIQYQSK